MSSEPQTKGAAKPMNRTAKQQRAIERRREADEQAKQLARAQTAAQQHAAKLAQIVNLHISGYSLADIGASIGATPEDVDRMLASDTQRYVRSQPALRTYVRNWVSERYTQLLDAVWDEATDKNHKDKLESADRAIKILDRMTRLHGAESPTQTEVKVEAAPEAVEKLVSALAAREGMGYDDSIFDVVDAEVVHDAPEQAREFLETSATEVDRSHDGEPEEGF